jgi:hypothetical protein
MVGREDSGTSDSESRDSASIGCTLARRKCRSFPRQVDKNRCCAWIEFIGVESIRDFEEAWRVHFASRPTYRFFLAVEDKRIV